MQLTGTLLPASRGPPRKSIALNAKISEVIAHVLVCVIFLT